jgi:hypothetical protein
MPAPAFGVIPTPSLSEGWYRRAPFRRMTFVESVERVSLSQEGSKRLVAVPTALSVTRSVRC